MDYPPFRITPAILTLVAEIQSSLGEFRFLSAKKPSLKLRKENKIKTIHHSLAIEGNSLSAEQISSILEGKRVLGPRDQIREVQNAIELYDDLISLDPFSERDLLKAHRVLMNKLLANPGRYRSKAVGILKGGKVSRMAPPAKQVPGLMHNLFSYLKKDKETIPLLKACIFHYELEFIHPFEDGNGRMGRLWQQLILIKVSPSFEFLPIESLIHKYQKQYYRAVEQSDVEGDSTQFITFSLEMILKGIKEYSGALYSGRPKPGDRVEQARDILGQKPFSRKNYLKIFKGLSTATASRDLARAVSLGVLTKKGTKTNATYWFSS